MAILVTGGAGYIGSHTCVELLCAGYDIVLLDNFSNAKADVIHRIEALGGKAFPVYETDILDEPGLTKVFQERDIDAVMHFAGLKAVGDSMRFPLAYYHNNVAGAIALCRVMAKSGCKRMVFSSSATVYCADNPIPYKEDYPTSAANPYGMSKCIVERILQDIAVADGTWAVAILRYFNPIGAHPSGQLGEDPIGIPNNLVPYIAQVAAGRLDYLQIYGDDYNTIDGTGVRDYLHVVDLAIGHLHALEFIGKNKGAHPINLGTGTGYSVLEVLHAFEKACGKTIPYRVASRRSGDLAAYYADPSKAQSLLNWTAQRTLDDMCADMWRYVSSQPHTTPEA